MKIKKTPSQARLVGTTLVLAIAALTYRLLVFGKLEQTSALFIGIPTILAIGFSLLPPAKSLTGALVKGTAIALALSGIFLGEGSICIAMATPLFLLVAVLVGYIVEKSRKKNTGRMLSLLILLPLTMEGVWPDFHFNRQEVVTVRQRVFLTESQILKQLGSEISLHKPLPIFLQMGFPRAEVIQGQGLAVGDQKCVHFSGGEGDPGDFCLEVASVEPSSVVFRAVKDDSHIAHWLDWDSSTVHWMASSGGGYEVVWTLRYTRLLDPAWYFAPIERYGVQLAGEYLLSSFFGD